MSSHTSYLDGWDNNSETSELDGYWMNRNVENALLFPLFKYLTTGKKRNRVEEYLLVVDSWSDSEFKEHLRLQRSVADQLIGNHASLLPVVLLENLFYF